MKKLLSTLLTFCALFTLSTSLFGQISVNGGLSGQQLAEILSGSNINVSNVTLNGSPVASGSFSSLGGFDFSSGVVLSTGTIDNCVGPNDDPNTSDNLGYPGTPEMDLLGGGNSWDAIWLEFDFVVQSTSVQFEYIFASEDYPEAAPPNNPSFNDFFAFFISGPGIIGEENIALIPGTFDQVSILNVNPITNTQYYVDNTGGQEIQFDGYTTPLIAFKDGLTSCGTYHLKLEIADIHNINRNSAVFLKENSFVQENVLGVETQTINADGVALEGCVEGSFTFAFDDVSNQDRIITYQVSGTAVNGVDYEFLDTAITIPVGETSGTVYIDAFPDGLTEGQEEIWLIYPSGGCDGENDTAYLFINDAEPIDFTLQETNLTCFENNTGEILVSAAGGFPPYSYVVTDENGNSFNSSSDPITGLAAGEYSVTVVDSYGCIADALVIGGVFDADTTFLPDGSGVTYDAPLLISGFNPGQTINNVNQIQQICLTMEHSYLGDLLIEVESPSGQIIILKQQNGGGSCDLGEPIASGPVDGNSGLVDPGSGYEYCFNANPVFVTMVGESNNFTRNYTDAQGNNYTDNYLPGGSYIPFGNFSDLVGSDMNGTWTVHVNDQFAQDNGYIFNWYISLIGDLPDTNVVILQPDEIVVSGVVTNSACGGADGSVNISISGAAIPYTFTWDNGSLTEDLTGVSAGEYTITVTDGSGCSVMETFLVNNIGSLSINGTVTDVTCEAGSNGAIDISPAGGLTPYTFNWSNTEITEDISTLSTGSYTVSIEDQDGCILAETFTINDGIPIVINAVAIDNEECNTDNGSIDIIVTGGSGFYGYQWSTNATTQDITGLNAGLYIIDVIDGNGCSQQDNFTILNDLSNCSSFCFLDANLNTLENETCGEGNGTIDITTLNGVAPVTFLWSNGALTEDVTSLTAETYTVTITDGNNCTIDQTYTIINESLNTITSAIIADENCGNGDGSITITVNGGAMPYSYLWSNGDVTENITDLSTDFYDLTVTDGNGCQISETYEITNNAGSLVLNGSVSNAICTSNNGSIDQTVDGGNGVITFLWSSSEETEDLSGLSSGTYTCLVTDETGCSTSEIYTVTETSGDILLIGSNITNEACGNGQGAVNITLTGNNLTYLWSNGAITEDLIGLSAGNYSCIITNAQGCELVTEEFSVINSSGTMNVSLQLLVDEICSNGNGSININITGGGIPYSFGWSNGSIDEDLIGLNAGIYSVLVTDGNGCAESHSFTINNSQGTFSIDNAVIVNENCGNGAGSIDLFVSGGLTNYSYVWSNAELTEDISGLSAGIYTVTAVDQNGCELAEEYEITNESGGFSVASQIANEVCTNSLGSIDLTITGGQIPITFNWSNAEITEDITGLSSGTYSCTITDNTGCVLQTETFTVNNTPSGLSASTIVTNAICSNDGSIDLTVVGAAIPITYAWSNSFTGEDPTGLIAGAYTYTVTDGNNCVISGSENVIATNAGLDYTFTVSNETCANGLGEINLSPSGGGGTYTFLWSNTDLTEDLIAIASGIYSCIISDVNGCYITTDNIQINNNSGTLEISDMFVNNEVCANGLGSIDLSTAGEVGVLTYLWSNTSTTEDITGLSAGVYEVTVTDINGCTVSSQATIISESGTMQILQPIVTDESCSNGQGAIGITIQGAVSPLFLWSNGTVTEDLTNLSAGSYSITVTDANGCAINDTYTVLNSGALIALANTVVNDEFCGSGSGSISITISGGTEPYNFDWSNGGQNSMIDNLVAGTYSVVVTDANGCSVQASYDVNNNAGNLSLSGLVTDEACGDGTGAINATATGGNLPLSFNWGSGELTEDISDLSEGSYDLVVTDNFGCTANFSGIVQNISGGIAVSITTITDENCGLMDGAVDVLVSGTGIVSTVWDNGAITEDLSGVISGTYVLTVTNDVGCSSSVSATVGNQTGTLAITFTNVVDETCLDGQGFVDIEVAGTGLFTYVWTGGQLTQDAVNLSSGSYTVMVTDGIGCILSETFQVNNINTSNIVATGIITDAFCSTLNGSIDITISGGIDPYTYSWDNGPLTEDISNLAAGTYELTITDDANCQSIQAYTLGSQSSGLGFTNLNITDEFCGQGNGEIVFFTGGTADDYYLDGVNLGGFTAENLSAGTYTVAISDDFGCYVDSVITVGSDAFFTVFDNSQNETCSDSNGAIDLEVFSGGPGGAVYTYLWSNGATTEDLANVTAGTYTVTVTNGGGFSCSTDYIVVIDNETTFEITSTTTADFCQTLSGEIDLTVVSGAGLTYLWSTGAVTEDLTGVQAGTYIVTVTDPSSGGCVEDFTYTVNATTSGMMLSELVTEDVCGLGAGEINITVAGGSGAYSYAWDNAEITEDISGLNAGTYVLTITDQGDNCQLDALYTVNNILTNFSGSGVVIGATCSTCANGSINVTLGSSTTYTYLWSNSAVTEDVSGLNPGNYSVVVSSLEGCDTTMMFAVENTVSIEDIVTDEIALILQPNPASSYFIINVELPEGQKGEVRITDAVGKLIETRTVSGSNEMTINTINLQVGTYFVSLETENRTKIERIIIYKD